MKRSLIVFLSQEEKDKHLLPMKNKQDFNDRSINRYNEKHACIYHI